MLQHTHVVMSDRCSICRDYERDNFDMRPVRVNLLALVTER